MKIKIALIFFLFLLAIIQIIFLSKRAPAEIKKEEITAKIKEADDWRKYALEYNGKVDVKIPGIKKQNQIKAKNYFIFSPYMNGRYDEIIAEAARFYNLDFYLIKAIIRAESDFNPRCISHKGAKGLMQIIPDNFEDLGISNPFHPWQNVFGGCLFYKHQLDKFGSHDKALWAYNAGPGAVDNYMPTETRIYISRVKKYYYQYSGQRLI